MASDVEVSIPELGTRQAGLRLKRLQHLAASLGLDGLLAVPGLDGRFNVGSAQLTGHLLLGTSNRDAADAVHLTPDLLDSVLLVSAAGISAYAPNGKASAALSELLGETAGMLQIVNPTPSEASDPDAVEECKLGAFVQMLRGMPSLGIPWALASATPDAPKPMELEKWPLLQAYGLEGVGKAGFFTQNFKVVDVSNELQHQVYGHLDGHAMEHYMAVAAPTLHQHWFEMIKTLGNKGVADLTERQVAESLLSYFSYGMLRPAHGVSQAVTMVPKVLVGTRTNDDSVSAEPLALKTAPGTAGLPAVHLIVEAADGRSPLRAARTYFLSQGALTPNLFADKEAEEEEGYKFEDATKGWDASDVTLLMRLYSAVAAAAKAAMQHFAVEPSATAASAKALALEQLAQGCDALGVPQPKLASQARFSLWECDHLNNVQAAAVRGSRKLKVLRLAVHDVVSRSSHHSGALLGAVVYADTFLEVPALGDHPALLLNLTERLPALIAASALGTEASVAARASRSFFQLASMSPETAAELEGVEQGQVSIRRRAVEERAERRRRRQASGRHAAGGKGAKGKGDHDAADGANGSGLAAEEEEEEQEEQEEEEEAEGGQGEDGDALADLGGTAGGGVGGLLGRLLTLGGGEPAVLLSGAALCAAVRGTLWCFAAGLAFVASGTASLWVLPFRGKLEAITVQELRPAAPGAGAEAEADEEAIGEAVVLRGRQPACGWAPACLLTTNLHVAIPLAGMTQTGRKHLLSTVLPAWQTTCRESNATEAPSSTPGAGEDDVAISYRKDPTADSPFPAQQYRLMLAAVQESQVGGARRRWPAMVVGDEAVEEAVGRLDKLELAQGFPRAGGEGGREGGLAPLDPSVEKLLLGDGSARGGRGVALTLVVGAPGAEQALVAATLAPAGASGQARIAWVPSGGRGVRVSQADVDAAVSALAAGPGAVSGPAVLCTACLDGTPKLLAMVAKAPAVVSGAVRLGSVVLCVAADGALQDPARGAGTLLPAVVRQLAPGYVDAVVVSGGGGAAGAGSAPGAGEVVAALQRRLPQGVPMLAVRGGGAAGRAVLSRSRDELLGLPAAERRQRLQEQADLRRWTPPPAGPSSPSTSAQLLWGEQQAVLLSFTGELDQRELHTAFQQACLPSPSPSPGAPPAAEPLPLLDPSAAAPGQRRQCLVAAYGLLRSHAPAAGPSSSATPAAAAPSGAVWELVASRQAGLRAREWPAAPLTHGAPAATSASSPCGQLLFIGSGLDGSGLQRMVERCGKGVAAAAVATAAAAALRTAATLTPTERSAIIQAHLFDPLPEGCCFDGTYYRDEFGDKLPHHPHLPQFIEAFLEEENAKRAAGQQAAAAAAAAGALVVQEVVQL